MNPRLAQENWVCSDKTMNILTQNVLIFLKSNSFKNNDLIDITHLAKTVSEDPVR